MLSGYQIQENEKDGACDMYRDEEKCLQDFGGEK
jgi:hypothetical protein